MPLPVGIKFHLPLESEDLRRVLRSCVVCSASVLEEKIGVVDGVFEAQVGDAMVLRKRYAGLLTIPEIVDLVERREEISVLIVGISVDEIGGRVVCGYTRLKIAVDVSSLLFRHFYIYTHKREKYEHEDILRS